MEMSAVHAEEVKNPQRDYPRALLYSTIIIFSSLVLGSIAIIVVVPAENLSVVSGLIDAYAVFFGAYHLPWMTQITAGLIILGGLSGVSAWIIGPTKGLLVSAQDGCLSPHLTKVNSHGVPVRILLIQAFIFTLLSFVFILVDSINGAYWLLSALCGQLALLVYIFMFAAAIRLRYSQPNQHRSYTIPGGNIGMWLVAGLGIACCIATIAISFIPPTQIPLSNVLFFEGYLIGGIIVFVVIPWQVANKYLKKKSP